MKENKQGEKEDRYLTGPRMSRLAALDPGKLDNFDVTSAVQLSLRV